MANVCESLNFSLRCFNIADICYVISHAYDDKSSSDFFGQKTYDEDRVLEISFYYVLKTATPTFDTVMNLHLRGIKTIVVSLPIVCQLINITYFPGVVEFIVVVRAA